MSGSAIGAGAMMPAIMGAAGGGAAQSRPMTKPSGGKGGGSVGQPTAQAGFAPLTPQGNFNVNQASAGALQQAMMGTQAGMGFQAAPSYAYGYTPTTQSVQGQQRAYGYAPAQQRAFTLSGQNISQYESPYQQAVIDRTMRDLSSAQEQSLNQIGAQATQARAFGGSRHGIAEAEARQGYAEQAADTIADLRERGFQQAMGAAQFDVGQLTGVEAANVAARTGAAQYGAGAQTAAEAANIQRAQQVAASNAAQQTEASKYMAQQRQAVQQQNFANQLAAMQQRQGAASQLASLGQQAFQTGQTIQQNQQTQGLLQQGLQQALIDAARGQYQGYVGSPSASLSAPLAALGVAAPNAGSTTTKSMQPGLFSYLQMIPGIG